MKSIKLYIVSIFVLTVTSVVGQTQKQINQEKNKVEIFNHEERANLHWVFYQKTQAMNLSKVVDQEYSMYLSHYAYDMQRLNDKDKDYTDDEIKEELGKLITKMNSRIEPILTEDQLKIHNKNWNDIMKVVYFKKGWEWPQVQ